MKNMQMGLAGSAAGEEQPIFTNRALVSLMFPLIIEQLLAVLVGMIDTLMVSVIGETAVSGVSLVDSVNFLLIQVLAALATGGCVVCSQFIGAGDPKRARQASGQLLTITAFGASMLTILALIGDRAFLCLIFGQTEKAVMDNAVVYFRYTALSYPFLGVYNSCAALFRSMGNSKISMYTSLIMNGMNIAGNAICIFGLGMGVEGVAIPTVISRMFAAVIMVILLHKPKNTLRVSSLSDLKPRFELIRQILGVGIPNGLENGMFQFGKVILSGLVSTLGTASIAGYAVAHTIATFMYLPGSALGIGLITVAGQCIGAKAYHQARMYTRKIVLVDYGFLAVICTIIVLARSVVVGWYHLSPEATVIAENMAVQHAVMMLIWPIAFVSCNTLRASGDARFTMILAVTVMWIFRVGGAYFFVYVLKTGVYGIWYAMTLDWIVRNIGLIWRFRGYEKRCQAKFG